LLPTDSIFQVRRVLFQSEAEEIVATGVEFVMGGERFEAHASEVIVSAGALHTPAILESSGASV